MPRKGELYKHKQIKDDVYIVQRQSHKAKMVYLKSTKGRGEEFSVSMDVFANSYERV